VIAAASLGLFRVLLLAQQPVAMQADVLEVIRAAHTRALMPWAEPAPEVDLVVRHGKAIVPYLIALLPDDPDDPTVTYDHWDEQEALAGRQFDERVEQHAVVALCRIYQLSPASCPMYSNRATRERNQDVKRFWLKVTR
jgi:hypothetical protein